MDHQQKSHANLNNLHEHAHSTESRLIQAEEEANRCHLLQNLIDQLPGRQKQIVHLRYYQGLTPSEISHTLGIHYQTVVNHLTTAFKSFREHKVTIRHRLD
ncbi:MAG: sigma-70 family RNA polymerase sigma factor [Bacteroidia bacterium]|nr:sigma-70 family RNA polymerase sigma factor [Bacteroidia bacterium]